MKFRQRLQESVSTVGSCLLHAGCLSIWLLFCLGSCSANLKAFLSWVGVWDDSPEQTVELRPFDPNNEGDIRIARSLLRLCNAAGIDITEVRGAIAVTDDINAAVVGENTFVFCEGVASLTDEQIDAIAAHEVAHAALDHLERSRDIVEKVQTAVGIVGSILQVDPRATEEVASWAQSVIFAPYSKEQELAADRKGVELLRLLEYGDRSPEVMIGALSAIADREGDVGGGFLSTHPAISERVQALQQLSAGKPQAKVESR